MTNSWLRLWHDMPNDPKWRTIAKVSGASISEVLSVYLHVLVDASNATERGRTQVNEEDVASALDLSSDRVHAILAAMEGRVIEEGRVTGWEKRQPQREDNSADRAKKWREEKKRTQPNATERNRTLEKIREEENIEPPISPAMVSQGILSELCLSGRDLAIAVEEVARAEMAKGRDATDLRDAMISAWRDYDLARPKLSYTKGAAKFFGDGDWRNKDGWPWKEGQAPAPKRRFIA